MLSIATKMMFFSPFTTSVYSVPQHDYHSFKDAIESLDLRPNALLSGKCATAITMGSSDVPSTEAAAGKRGI